MEEIKKFEERPINIRRSRHGSPCYWESAKEFETMSRLSFVYNEDGEEKTPIYIKRETSERLVPIIDGDYLVKIFFEKGVDFQGIEESDNFSIGKGIGISILRIKEISKYQNAALAEIVERKPSDSANWLINDRAFPIPEKIKTILFLKIKNLIK